MYFYENDKCNIEDNQRHNNKSIYHYRTHKGENNIDAPKMQINFWCTIKLLDFSILRQQLLSLLISLIFRIVHVHFFMAFFLYCYLYSYQSSNQHCNSNGCCSLQLLNTIVKSEGNYIKKISNIKIKQRALTL